MRGARRLAVGAAGKKAQGLCSGNSTAASKATGALTARSEVVAQMGKRGEKCKQRLHVAATQPARPLILKAFPVLARNLLA